MWYCQTGYCFFTAVSVPISGASFLSYPIVFPQYKSSPHVVAGTDKGHPDLDPADGRCKDAASVEDPLDDGERVLHGCPHL